MVNVIFWKILEGIIVNINCTDVVWEVWVACDILVCERIVDRWAGG